jgi:hypothetical protein
MRVSLDITADLDAVEKEKSFHFDFATALFSRLDVFQYLAKSLPSQSPHMSLSFKF